MSDAPEMTRRPIIVDTDPGHDDALALLLALAAREELDLLGITTVAGNVRVGQTTVNALKICELAGRPEVPVHEGCPGPIIRPLRTAEFIVGPDGLGGMSLPEPVTRPASRAAVPFLVDTIRAHPEPVTLCTLGPLTNVALALVMAPDIAEGIDRLVMMGGSRDLGNITAAGEFNVYTDPHAAHIVLSAGLDVTLIGLNATYQAVATASRIAPFEAPGGRVSAQVVRMLRRERPGGKALGGEDGHPMHDPCVVAAILWPELFATRDCRVDVELAEGPTVGRTTIDWWGRSGAEPNAAVVDTLEADAMFARMAARIHELD